MQRSTHGNCLFTTKSRLGIRGNPKRKRAGQGLKTKTGCRPQRKRTRFGLVILIGGGDPPKRWEACHRRQGITGAWRRAVRGGWRRHVSRESPGNLGDPAGRAGQQVAPAPRRQGIHNLLSCPGRESDLPIVARKRLTPVEPRGRTLIVFSSREGKPLEQELRYGRRV